MPLRKLKDTNLNGDKIELSRKTYNFRPMSLSILESVQDRQLYGNGDSGNTATRENRGNTDKRCGNAAGMELVVAGILRGWFDFQAVTPR